MCEICLRSNKKIFYLSDTNLSSNSLESENVTQALYELGIWNSFQLIQLELMIKYSNFESSNALSFATVTYLDDLFRSGSRALVYWK